MVRILLADDHALIRKGFRDCLALLESSPDIVEADSLEGVVATLEHGGPFDLVILDLYMPGANGLHGLDVLQRRWPSVPVAIMSGSVARHDVMGSLERGAAGFIPKSLDLTAIQGAVRLLLSGGRYLPPVMLEWTGGRANPEVPAVPGLTRRESEVWHLLKDGRSNKEIGRLLGLQEVTVKLHVRSLLRKLGVSNRTQATALYMRAAAGHS